MNPAAIVEKAGRCGVRLALNDAGTGLSLSADSAPQEEMINLLRDARDVLVAHLQQTQAIRSWINNCFTSGTLGVCMHCGRRWLTNESTVRICCGAEYGEVHEACWEEWEAEQDRRARAALGFA
jgi:hypothetical protein